MKPEFPTASFPAGAAQAVSTELYWVMPTARGFLDALGAKCAMSRNVKIRLPFYPIVGLHRAMEAALERAHLPTPARRWLKIEDGMQVGTQVGAALGEGHMSPEELVLCEPPEARAIILEALGPQASVACSDYLQRFANAQTPSQRPGAHLKLIALVPETIEGSSSNASDNEIRYSGALSHGEMSAYLAIRMADRSGPHTTGLLRQLVTEFSGFDASFAEVLMGFSDMELLAMPESLPSLVSDAEGRWRSGQWAALCYAELAGSQVRHTLYEIHLSRHPGPDQRSAQESLRRKYWRACVRSILPYLEEHRSAVMAPLRSALESHTKHSGGKLVRPTISGRRSETTSLDDVEYNQIPGLIHHEQFVIPSEPKARLAVKVCFAAKTVRDETAHMRAPRPESIMELASAMEAFQSA